VVEDTAVDTIVLDLEGLASLFGADRINIAHELAQRASRVGVIPHVAVASNIETAVLAARGFPGITDSFQRARNSRAWVGCPIRTRWQRIWKCWKHWSAGVWIVCALLRAASVCSFRNGWGKRGVRLARVGAWGESAFAGAAEAGLEFEEE